MIKSIKKVKVTDISEILPFTDETVNAVKRQFGVYLIFIPLQDRNPSSFRTRNYCKIGRVAGDSRGVRGRLLDNFWVHTKRCKPEAGHYFQVLACGSGEDAARLEVLFHLWHGRYEGGRTPIEPEGVPLAEKEPDFFYLSSD